MGVLNTGEVFGIDIQRAFEILKMEVTKEEEQIRAAYRNKLVSVNPEDNPEGFKRLREAYEAALSFARQREEGGQESRQDDPVSLFLKSLEDIYGSLSRRLDGEEWERLARALWEKSRRICMCFWRAQVF